MANPLACHMLHQAVFSALPLTVLAEGVRQVVNGVLNGAFPSDPGLDSKSEGCQHPQPSVTHLHRQKNGIEARSCKLERGEEDGPCCCWNADGLDAVSRVVFVTAVQVHRKACRF